MKEFVVEEGNGEDVFCFFEDDGETGYFYLYEPQGEGIIDHLHIYSKPEDLKIREKDVEVIWSGDKTKCALRIWGKVYGIFDITSNYKVGISVRNKNTPPIVDPKLLAGL